MRWSSKASSYPKNIHRRIHVQNPVHLMRQPWPTLYNHFVSWEEDVFRLDFIDTMPYQSICHLLHACVSEEGNHGQYGCFNVVN